MARAKQRQITEKSIDPYAELSILSFEKRTETEIKNALLRPAIPQHSHELRAISARIRRGVNPFHIDQSYITKDFTFRSGAQKGQVTPSFSHGFETRMTHTRSAAAIAEQLADRMYLGRLSAELAQAIVFAHDIGHGPFSHESEEIFNRKLKPYGGKWDHDYFGLQIVTELAHGGLTYKGLPLNVATLEGVAKRYKRFYAQIDHPDKFHRPRNELPPSFLRLAEGNETLFQLDKWNSIEGQIAAISDWIAFTVSDTRDMLLLNMHNMPAGEFEAYANELLSQFPPALRIWKAMKRQTADTVQKSGDGAIVKKNYHAFMQSTINLFSQALESTLIDDVLAETHRRFTNARKEKRIRRVGDERKLDHLLIGFSPEMEVHVQRYGDYYKEKIFPELLNKYVNVLGVMDKFFDLVKNTFDCQLTHSPTEENPPQPYKINARPFSRKPEWHRLHQEDESKPPLCHFPQSRMKIDAGWLKQYQAILENGELDDLTRARSQLELICAYIAVNFTDMDVMYYVKHHDRQFYADATKGRQDGVYPNLAHPDAVDGFQLEEAIRASRRKTEIRK